MDVKFTLQAVEDVENIYEFISKDDKCVAKSVLSYIEKMVDYIKEFPEFGKKGDVRKTREVVVPKLPFLIVYEIVDEVIYILTIFHTAQDPRKKFKK